MRVSDVRLERDAGSAELSATFAFAGERMRVSIRAPEAMVVPEADGSPFLAIGLLPAMLAGEDLEIDAPVSARLLEAAPTIAAIYAAWDPRLRFPTVTSARSHTAGRPAAGTGCFFSRGADSMLSAAVARTRPAPLTHLVFVDGLEMTHSPPTAAAELRIAGEAAERLALPLIAVVTDARVFADRFWKWENMHGSVLAGVGLALGGGLGRVVIPSTDSVASLVPYGSSPLVDPLYSTERVALCHDDVTLTRAGKIAALVAQRPDLLPFLKVCFEEDRSDNCGRCGKCLITMAALEAAGGLALATQFPATIDVARIRSLSCTPIQSRLHWLAVARALPPGALRDAIATALRRSARPTLRRRWRLSKEWLRGRRARLASSWADPDLSFDRRFNDELLGLFVDGRPERKLAERAEPPLVPVRLRADAGPSATNAGGEVAPQRS